MLLDPGSGVIHLDFRYRKLMSSRLVDDRKGKGLHAIRRIESATVTVRLLLIIFTGLNIYD
jgi:hypothetical protein